MKSLHRVKTLAAYDGARLLIKNEMCYPAYMMLKESARGVLSYIVEDWFDKEISEKMKLTRLVEFVTPDMVGESNLDGIKSLIDLENGGIEAILSVDIQTLLKVKASVKNLIADYMKEPI